MLKVRLLCTKHECDVDTDGPILTAELQSDVDPNVRLGEPDDLRTGYYLFDLSHAWCNKDEFNEFNECQDYWRVVVYNGEYNGDGRKAAMIQ